MTAVRRLLALAVVVSFAVTAVGGVAAVAVEGLVRSSSHRVGYGGDDLLVVLGIGSDQGPPLRPGDPTRGLADGIHLFVVDTATDRMTVVDFARDSAIGGGKVNGHLARGGPEQLEAQLEAYTGLAIDFWVLGSFQTVEAVAMTSAGSRSTCHSAWPTRSAGPICSRDPRPSPPARRWRSPATAAAWPTATSVAAPTRPA